MLPGDAAWVRYWIDRDAGLRDWSSGERRPVGASNLARFGPPADVASEAVRPATKRFSETLRTGSHAELLNAAGAKVVDAAIDASNPEHLVFGPGQSLLTPGNYTVQWTSVAADKDVARGQLSFTVAAATPIPATPTPAATATAAPTAAATVAPTATAAPSPTAAHGAAAFPAPAPTSPGGVTDAIIPIIAALALVAVVAMVLLRRVRAA